MKIYISTISIIIMILTTVVGCQDIDLLPKENLSNNQFWKTSSDYSKAANTLYSRMTTFSSIDTESDISRGEQTNTVSNGTYIAPNKDDVWSNEFKSIRDCNKIIYESESYEGNFKDIERYVSEARFFRAFSYWNLMKKFTDVPLITDVLSVESPELYSERDPQEKIEDFILSELNEIYSTLPKQSDLTGTKEDGRVTEGAVLALKARVALFAGTWAKYHNHRKDYQQLLDQAIDAAEKIRKSGEYSLYEGSGDHSYRYFFIDDGDNSLENILTNRYFKEVRMHSNAHFAYWGELGAPTKKLADMYLVKSTGLPIESEKSEFVGYQKVTDEFKNRDPRMSQTFLMPGATFLSTQDGELINPPSFNIRPVTKTGYKLYKFMGEIQEGEMGHAEYDYPVIRYPEVLLILAESIFEKNDYIDDEDLNKTINESTPTTSF